MENFQPKDFDLETSTVWAFPKRGNWATHMSKYRGNWAPQIPRNIILRYSKKGDIVLDPMVGSGTTLIETKLTGRKGIGYDINPEAVNLTKKSLDFDFDSEKQVINLGDARNLKGLGNESIDLIATHPPYANIIQYSEGKINEDLSSIKDLDSFYDEIDKMAKEFYRVLKTDKYCAILMGDTRKNKHYIPMAFNVMQRFLNNGFVLKENVIKHQYNTKTQGFWSERSKKYNFLLIMHEHLFIFRKP
jgi:DNA modification methylase